MLAGLRGRVIEVGAGNGLNFAHYPSSVTEVVAIEPEDYLRGLAAEAAAEAPVPVEVMDGLADDLPFDAGRFDAGVASLVLCTVPDQAAALQELRRVIRPGGELRFYEHVLAESRALSLLQHAVAPVWQRLGGGCHLDRDTVAGIEGAGFTLESCRRFPFLLPLTPHVIGVARRP
jgi:ubiquinone/menaquinone biosynthesis C-methylase UbiE